MVLCVSEFEIAFEKTARIDLEEIYYYIVNKFFNKAAADRLINKMFNQIEILKELPCAYPILYNYIDKNEEYRRIVVKNYSIIYYVLKEEETVVIVHIYYNKRKFFNF